MSLNYANSAILKKIAQEIKSFENIERKQLSLKQFEVYMDRMLPFVKQHLQAFYGADDINSLPVISAINLCKRIVNQEAKIYMQCPKRTFTGVSEEQAMFLEELYESMHVDAMMLKSNQYFKLQAQNTVQIIPIEGFNAMPKLGWLFENGKLVSNLPDVTPRQIRQALILSGVSMESIDAALNSMPEPTRSLAKTEWSYSIACKRHRDLVNQDGVMLGWTSEQLDDLWAFAGKL